MFSFLAVLLILFLIVAASLGALAEAITMLAGVSVAVILITIFGG